MAKKLKKNSFIEGTMFAYIAILAAKVMGALYSIPFYNIIGIDGGVIYSCAYNIYALFLEISTSGIPIAVSIVVSEYNTRNMIRSKERTYTLTMRFVTAISVLCFLVMQIFAKGIGMYFMKDMTHGVTPDQIAFGIRAISFCLLIVPFLSLKRGYLQGHKVMVEPSNSQVIEQFVRIVVVLAGSYTAIKLLKLDTQYGVGIALLGATAGAVAAYLYLTLKMKNSKELFAQGVDKDEQIAADKEILKKVFSYCITIVIITVSESLYNIIDMKMILTGLHHIGYPDADVQEVASIASTWIPKIGMIITALSMGITNSLSPHIAEKNTDGDMKEVNNTLNQALGTFLLISVPLAIGMIMLAKPIYILFYGESAFGAGLLRFSAVVNVVGSLVTIVCLAMQSIGKGKIVCIYTLVGIAVNGILDLPLIYGFNKIGIPAYLGAAAASVTGQCVVLILLFISLRKMYSFSFTANAKLLFKMLPGCAALILVVFGLGKIWSVTETRGIMLIVQLGVYAVCGGGVYFLLSFLTKAVSDVVGANELNRLFAKLHLPIKKINGISRKDKKK